MTHKRRAAAAPAGQPPKAKKPKPANGPPQRQPPAGASQSRQIPKKQTTTTVGRDRPRIAPVPAATTGSTSLSVVPAIPGAAVHIPATKAGASTEAVADDEEPETETGGSRQRPKQPKKGNHTGQQKQQQPPPPPPPTLPMEPHAAVLAALRPAYDVRVLSVISSTRMEKRIKAVLAQLDGQTLSSPSPSPPPPPSTNTNPLPGIVLLHARAHDAGKMISLVEIAKRRIREGYFAPKATAIPAPPTSALPPNKKTKQKLTQPLPSPATAWFQYNRLYDVEVEAKTPPPAVEADKDKASDKNKEAGSGDGDDDDDDGFEPMPSRFRAAIGDASAPQNTVTTTYMSIVLARVRVPELERDPAFTAQASDDPLETEYAQWMSQQ
ncbi:DNA/RNA-binding protein Alba-like protein [Niveomyces insectorum RCEF 264]|uniref:DNA/RNA-binding protein Alba-like protein n=1 Tax=Niveomyces insectorum RCEF 264 TaxID=1081102 RepID=A0A167YQX7_9HYPO|nr:DNA/RNA-binding protein Alba-like protein [Niveomyces insectorum RCEF 264]